MRAAPGTLAALALAAAGLACAHAPPPRAPALPSVTWPSPPDEPRVKLAALLPDPSAPRPRRSFWKKLADVVFGRDADDEAELVARPFGIAVGPDGTVFVADPDKPAVVRLTASGVVPVTCRGREWSAPIALAIAEDGALLVADAGDAEVVEVAASGCRAFGRSALERPAGIALLGDRVAVVDPPRHHVAVFSRRGDLVATWGAQGSGEGGFYFPTGVAAAPDGTLLVVDALNFRIVRLSGAGEWLRAFGAPGESDGAFARPKAVAVDGQGRIFVSDAQRDLVLVYDRDGTYSYAIGASGAEPGALSLPAGVAVAAGKLFVADSHNRRVQVFEFLGGDR